MIFDGMLRNIRDGKPFLMYPRFVQVFLNKQLEGLKKPKQFLQTVVLPPKVFTFIRKNSDKFSGTITPLNAHMLAVAATVVSDEPSATQVEDDPSQAAQPTPSRSQSPNDLS